MLRKESYFQEIFHSALIWSNSFSFLKNKSLSTVNLELVESLKLHLLGNLNDGGSS